MRFRLVCRNKLIFVWRVDHLPAAASLGPERTLTACDVVEEEKRTTVGKTEFVRIRRNVGKSDHRDEVERLRIVAGQILVSCELFVPEAARASWSVGHEGAHRRWNFDDSHVGQATPRGSRPLPPNRENDSCTSHTCLVLMRMPGARYGRIRSRRLASIEPRARAMAASRFMPMQG